MTFAPDIPQTLTTTYLEMTSRPQLHGALQKSDDIRIERMNEVDVNFYLYLYKAVGEKCRWRDRLVMSRSELHQILSKPTTHVYVLTVGGTPAGYVELDEQGDSTEIAYFGLREAYHGRGLGKYLLSFGINQAWEQGAKRVFVHTCNLDGSHALANYQKRGFRVYMQHNEPMPQRYL
ncbi:MAG: GNAT family N-acetyltransferase [Anaerolineae bacterium]|nr:GNAT family N-acetyltransferase [Anaerolineae bacterium]MDQ7035113.1 GNAT family N-acetyltransferase [Anaerolineae bacterium]